MSSVAGRLEFTAPKTPGSSAGVGLSARVVAALVRQAARQEIERAQWGSAYEGGWRTAQRIITARQPGRP